jgi:hypothetical protein
MDSVIDKELLSQLLKLEVDQQEKVLAYIKELLEADEINKRANASEQAIKEGRTKSLDQFNEDFEQWKIRKRANTK